MVWIDHREARVFHFNAEQDSEVVVNSHVSVQRLHHQADHPAGDAVDTEFFHRIVGALTHTGGTLVTGPGGAKYALAKYMNQHRPDLAAKVSDQTLAHPGDAEVLALARDFYKLDATVRPASDQGRSL
jgi:stalled ribosome rescue protein Dom34